MPIEGVDQLRALSARLKEIETGRPVLNRMRRGLRVAAVPIRAQLSAAAARDLPQTGGLAARVSSEHITTSVLSSRRTTAVRLTQRKHDAWSTDRGYVRKPVFGVWRPGMPSQRIPRAAGWWTKTGRESASTVVPEMLAVLEQIAAEIGDI